MKEIIQQLEEYRLENRITQVELAKRLKVSFCTVNRWLTGKNDPSRIQEYHIKKLLSQGKKS